MFIMLLLKFSSSSNVSFPGEYPGARVPPAFKKQGAGFMPVPLKMPPVLLCNTPNGE